MKRTLITTLALTMIAAAAFANEGGGGVRGFEGYGQSDAIVASNGTIFITSSTIDTGTRTSTTTIKAISASGTVIWTATLTNAGRLELSGNNLIATNVTSASDGTVSTTLTAISTSSGSVAWTRTLSGRVTSLEPFSAGTYAIVVVPATTSGGSATRSLVAIGNDGSVLWTVSLT
jgi:putative pyrroloquinoline-quinone binding quinoprotein